VPKISNDELKSILQAQKADALSPNNDTKLASDRARALDYYNGDVKRDIPTIEGRSKAVSSDVADTIEGMMPVLMEIFAGSDEVVRFEPVGEEDVAAAEQETDYVNHVFMQKNPGFIVLYSLIKDALLSKVGISKVWWEKYDYDERETYLDQPDDVLGAILSNPDVEVVEHATRESEYGPLHDVTITRKKTYACAKCEPVPPEEFGIDRYAKCIRDANYCYHEPIGGRTEAELIEAGFDAKQIKKLPSFTSEANDDETLSRDTVEESNDTGGDTLNTALRRIKIVEHYIKMQYEGDKPLLYRVTTGGDECEVLRRNGKPDIEEIDMMPFAAMTPIIVTHRFFGRSIADLVIDIQQINTILLRAMLDNAYLCNFPRPEISESHSTQETLDDLLNWRPGAVIRTKNPGGLNWQTIPPMADNIFPVMQYMDARREWRTGVTRQGQGLDANALQNQTATAAMQLHDAAQARIKLIARIFAETGIKDLFWLLHATIRKNGDQPATFRLRGSWVTVDPRNWKSRDDLTVEVGLGTGSKMAEIGNLNNLLQLQEKILVEGKGLNGMVNARHIYNTSSDLVRAMKRKDVDRFFSEPQEDEVDMGEDPEAQKLQGQAQIEMMKIQAEQQARQQDVMLKREEAQFEAQLKEHEMQHRQEIERLQAEADIASKREEVAANLALAREKHAMQMEHMAAEHQLKMAELSANMQFKEHAHSLSMAQKAQDAKAKKPEARA
jgi:hypothetical protein